jgi:amidase
VPLAFGTQTAGSIVRPASYCGIVGYKPSYGTLPRAGVKTLADSLDTLGVMARSPGDAALLVGALSGRDLLPAPMAFGSKSAPKIALCRTHEWPAAQPETAAALEHAAKAAAQAGARVKELALPKQFAGLLQAQIDLMNYEAYGALASDRLHHWDGLSETLKKLLATASKVSAARYDEARALTAACRAMLGDVFGDADAIVAPSAPGEAPPGLAATGDPVFCRVWTLLGVPALNIPCSQGPNGMPVGVQVIGRIGDDARALAVAEWLQPVLA